MAVSGVLDSFRNSYEMQPVFSARQEQFAVQETEADKKIAVSDREKEITDKQDSLHYAAAEEKKEIVEPIDLKEVSLTFHKEESFDYIGNDSSLENLDMQKAVSDMQKDQVLQQYQYFVGSARSLFGEPTEDGAVVLKDITGIV